ncbi:hypothetical protein D0S45_18145 [Marinifilum sp. JC120]|nr:hypothetical protein D0S45_18145 [Marinifilum sp. JC120]
MSEIEIRYIDHTAIPENSRVCLYGISTGGAESLKLLRQIRSDVEIVCFADTYQSGLFEGIEILSPQALVERKNEYDLILVCSCYYPEIIKHLHSLDINNVAGFSWPKFYGYQFLPDEIVALKNEIKFIQENLYSESDRTLFNILCEARVVGSSSVELVYVSEGMGNFLFNEVRLEKAFPEHTTHCAFPRN